MREGRLLVAGGGQLLGTRRTERHEKIMEGQTCVGYVRWHEEDPVHRGAECAAARGPEAGRGQRRGRGGRCAAGGVRPSRKRQRGTGSGDRPKGRRAVGEKRFVSALAGSRCGPTCEGVLAHTVTRRQTLILSDRHTRLRPQKIKHLVPTTPVSAKPTIPDLHQRCFLRFCLPSSAPSTYIPPPN